MAQHLCNGCHTPSACREASFCWDSVVIQTRCHEQKTEALANPRPAERIAPGSTGPVGNAGDPLMVGSGYSGATAAAPQAAPRVPAAPAKPRQQPAGAPRAAPGPGGRPAAGSTTGRVWALADQCKAAHGDGPLDRDFRRKVIAACEADNINSSTASVQYSKWLSTQA